jgi:hypothetical protein
MTYTFLINIILSFLGLAGIMEKLMTTLDKGLSPVDFEARAAAFSTNYKAPPVMTPYWKLFLGALDDFMLKFLLCCACVQIVIECSFADAEHLQTGKFI